VRLRIASVLTAGALLIGTAVAMAGPASAGRTPQASSKSSHAAPASINKGYCNYTSDAVNDSLSSQNFEASFDAFDDMGAADCKIGRRKKVIHQEFFPGVYYNGYGPAASVNLIAWSNAAGLPGSVFNSQTVVCADAAGSFTCDNADFSAKGTKWFTAQANMDFYAGGQWGWDTSTVAHGPNGDQWQNPGGGFGICPTWCPVGTLDGSSVSFLYAIS
jgi:hypothetical protein